MIELSEEQKKAVAEEIAENVAIEKATVTEETDKATIEEEKVSVIAAEANKIATSAAADLAKAEPAVENAMKALAAGGVLSQLLHNSSTIDETTIEKFFSDICHLVGNYIDQDTNKRLKIRREFQEELSHSMYGHRIEGTHFFKEKHSTIRHLPLEDPEVRQKRIRRLSRVPKYWMPEIFD